MRNEASPRIVVRLTGGLGNQLFQYATARRLAYINSVPLYLDAISGFERDRFDRSFSLQAFNIEAALASRRDCYAGHFGRILRYLGRKRDHAKPFEQRKFVTECGDFVNRQLLALKVTHDVYLEGYWQSEEYFKDIAELLRRELTPVAPLPEAVTSMEERIREEAEAVCLHVRRLYRQGKTDEDKAIETDACYYREAIRHVTERLGSPHFFIFSDDPQWIDDMFVPEFIPAKGYTNVDREIRGKDFEILYLMACCRHFITSFSTFSWWGAWLGQSPGKIVCTYIGSTSQWEEIVPVGWVEF